MNDLNKCFNCQKYSCENCPELEPDMKLINPETEKELTKSEIDELLGRK
jgi:hypothetical protein